MRKTVTVAVVSAVVGALVAVPVAVFASHSFNDVPGSNTFHEDIAWLEEAGVTKGCNPPANTEYCPKDEVTREQMAAFMHRLADNQVVDAAAVDGFELSELAPRGEHDFQLVHEFNVQVSPLSTVTLELPSAGTVFVSGTVNLSNAVAPDNGSCHITLSEGSDTAASSNWHTHPSLGGPNIAQCQLMGAIVLGPGTYEFFTEYDSEVLSSAEDTWVGSATVQAIWVPFDGQGNTPVPSP